MMNAMERKQNMDKEKQEQLKSLQQANAQLPKGSLEHYAATIQAKVDRFEENK